LSLGSWPSERYWLIARSWQLMVEITEQRPNISWETKISDWVIPIDHFMRLVRSLQVFPLTSRIFMIDVSSEALGISIKDQTSVFSNQSLRRILWAMSLLPAEQGSLWAGIW
jgi:hypothetical protein